MHFMQYRRNRVGLAIARDIYYSVYYTKAKVGRCASVLRGDLLHKTKGS